MSGKIASMARNAEKNNDKLFPIFQKNLSSDTLPEFATTAHKLAGWLNSDKAYYANARHKIVDLIETAHETVRRHSGFPDQPLNISRCSNEARSWAEPFIQIVRTVVPFFPLFTEPVLQLRLRALMQTLYENIDWLLPQQTSVAPPVVTPVASTSSTPRSTSSPSSSLRNLFRHSSVTPAPQSPIATTGPTRPHSTLPLTEALSKVGQALVQAGSGFAATPSEPATLTEASTNPLPPFVSAPLSPPPIVSAPRPSLPHTVRPAARNLTAPAMAHEAATNTTNMEQSRPKAKKRKTLPFETDFIEADLMWFKDKRAVDSPTNLQEVHIADLSTAEPTSTDGVPRSVSEKPTETSPLAAKTSDIANPPSNKQSPTILSAQGPTTEDGKSIAGPQAAPGSPVILGPSITRREPTSASPDTSSHSPEKALSVTGEALPSPLPTKRSKKRKRGPPGLKILPVISTGSPGENLALGDSISTSIATGELVETLNSTPVPPQRPLANVAESRADHSVEAGEPIASSHAFEGTVTTVDSPVAMDADELVRSVDVIARGADTTEGPVVPNGEGRSSGDVEMRDPASSTSSQAPVSPLPLFLPSSSQSSLYTPSIRPFELDISTSTTTLTANSSSSSIDTQAMVTIEDRVAESLPKTEIPVKTSTTTAPAPAALPVEQPDPQTPFANTSARVLSMVRGASSMTPASHPVVGDFELTADELVQIARWNDRTKLSDDLSKTLCISFVSYLVSQCIDASAGEPQEVSNVDECGPLASWPQDGTAFVVVNDGQGADRFTVSPPFMTTIDKCIDLGTRGLRAGPNTLHLFQYRDHSDRFFVVILHHPTRAQLMELQNARNKAREWQRFVEGLGRIELHVPRLFPSPALNGNFVSHG